MQQVKENIEYAMCVGTSDERSVPIATNTTLGTTWDQTFGAIFQIHKSLMPRAVVTPGQAQHTQVNPLVPVIQSIWTLWCYTANDLGRIRAELADALKAVEELQANQEMINEQLAELQGAK